MTTPRRRSVFVVGAVLAVVGAGMLGWLGWEYWGTTWVAHARHAAITDELHRQWAQGRPAAELDEGLATAVVRIPAFGADYAVPLLEGTSDSALAAGFGHIEGSVGPGEVGNFALAGHRVTHGEPLARMPELRPGDEVIIETDRAVYTYVLDTGGDDLRVDFDRSWVLDPLPKNPDGGVEPAQEDGQRLLTLTTCAELFHTDERLVAFGHLESRARR